jgi:hypothetical protein
MFKSKYIFFWHGITQRKLHFLAENDKKAKLKAGLKIEKIHFVPNNGLI